MGRCYQPTPQTAATTTNTTTATTIPATTTTTTTTTSSSIQCRYWFPNPSGARLSLLTRMPSVRTLRIHRQLELSTVGFHSMEVLVSKVTQELTRDSLGVLTFSCSSGLSMITQGEVIFFTYAACSASICIYLDALLLIFQIELFSRHPFTTCCLGSEGLH